MKVFVKDQAGRFLTGSGGWSKQFEKARDFRKTPAALAYCFKNQLLGVHICTQLADAGTAPMLLFRNHGETCPPAHARSPAPKGAPRVNRARSARPELLKTHSMH